MQKDSAVASATEYREKLARRQSKMGGGFFSFKPYIQKNAKAFIHHGDIFKIKIQMKLRIPQRPSQKSSHGGIHHKNWKCELAWCVSEHTTVDGFATIPEYLHNHIYTTITLILPNPNKTSLKISQTTQKGLSSAQAVIKLWLLDFRLRFNHCTSLHSGYFPE